MASSKSGNNIFDRYAGVGNENLGALSAVTKLFKSKKVEDSGNFLDIVRKLIEEMGLKNVENFDLDELEANMNICYDDAEDKKSTNPSIPLTTSEIAALALYSSHSDFYRVLNANLRSENRTLVEPFVDIIWLIMVGLSKCPLYTKGRTVFRGVKLDLSQKYKRDAKITWHQFSSCSLSLETLSENMFAGAEGDRTVFVIELTTTRARRISMYSLYPGENEVLLPPNTRFVVKGMVDMGSGLKQFHLEEAAAFDPILKYGDSLDSLKLESLGISSPNNNIHAANAIPAPLPSQPLSPSAAASELDSKSANAVEDAEVALAKAAIDDLKNLMISNGIVATRVAGYITALVGAGIGSKGRLVWELSQTGRHGLLEELNFNPDDCKYIRSLLNIPVPVEPASSGKDLQLPAPAPANAPLSPPPAPQTTALQVGDRVTVVDNFKSIDDSGAGPLQLGDIGTLIKDDKSDKPYQITADSGYSKDKMWWYVANAIRRATPEEIRIAVANIKAMRVYKVGNYVRIKSVSQAEAEIIQNLHGGLGEDRVSMLGKHGVVVNVDSDGDCEVSVEGYPIAKLWNPAILEYISELPPAGPISSSTPSTNTSQPDALLVGQFVTLADNYGNFGDAASGPLKPGDVGELIKDDGSSKPHQVRSTSGATWWYMAGALKRANKFKVGDSVAIRSCSVSDAEQAQKGHGEWSTAMGEMLGKTGTVIRVDSDGDCEVRLEGTQTAQLWNPSLLEPTRLPVGCKVRLSSGFAAHGDASSGPLNLGDIGELVKDDNSGKPYQVKASDGKLWWYHAAALERAGDSAAPSSGSSGLAVGNRVRVRPVTIAAAEEGMKGHGGWGVDMGIMLGRVGTITQIDSDGDCKVLCDQATGPKLWNPALLEFLAPAETQPGGRLNVGDKVTVVADYESIDDASSGPMKEGDVGTLTKDDHSTKPYQVQCAAKTWWYKEQALRRITDKPSTLAVGDHVRVYSMSVQEAENAMKGHGGYAADMGIMLGLTGVIARIDNDGDCEVKMDGGGGSKVWNPLMLQLLPDSSPAVGSSTRLIVGDKVMLSPNFASFGDSAQGPLKPSDIGEVIKDDGSSKPFQIKTKDGTLWWYVEGALQRTSSAASTPVRAVSRALAVGNHVRIRAVSVAEAEAAMKGHGGYVADMGIMLGRTGVVTRIDSDGDCEVRVDGGAASKLWNPLLLEYLADVGPSSIPTGRLTVGESVTLADGFEASGDASKGPLTRGDIGTVVKDDGSEIPFQVQVDTKTWWYRESALKRVSAGSMAVFRVGQSVRIRMVPVAEAEAAQRGHGGWLPSMTEYLGKSGEITKIDSDGDCEVTVGGSAKLWNPLLLDNSLVPVPAGPATRIKVGESVTVVDGFEAIGDASNGPLEHGGVGIVVKDDASEVPFQVKVGDKSWWYRAAAIRRVVAAPAPQFSVGNVVKIRNVTVAEAEAAQHGHGGWVNSMQSLFGQEGNITAVDNDGDCTVSINGDAKMWNPILLELVPGTVGNGRFIVGDCVSVVDGFESVGDARNGPLAVGDIGVVLKDDQSDVPFQVQFNGKSWWYRAAALKRVAPARLNVGDRVTVVQGYEAIGDAAGGPLRPGDVGTLLKDDGSEKPYHVQTIDGQKKWWYMAAAVRKL